MSKENLDVKILMEKLGYTEGEAIKLLNEFKKITNQKTALVNDSATLIYPEEYLVRAYGHKVEGDIYIYNIDEEYYVRLPEGNIGKGTEMVDELPESLKIENTDFLDTELPWIAYQLMEGNRHSKVVNKDWDKFIIPLAKILSANRRELLKREIEYYEDIDKIMMGGEPNMDKEDDHVLDAVINALTDGTRYPTENTGTLRHTGIPVELYEQVIKENEFFIDMLKKFPKQMTELSTKGRSRGIHMHLGAKAEPITEDKIRDKNCETSGKDINPVRFPMENTANAPVIKSNTFSKHITDFGVEFYEYNEDHDVEVNTISGDPIDFIDDEVDLIKVSKDKMTDKMIGRIIRTGLINKPGIKECLKLVYGVEVEQAKDSFCGDLMNTVTVKDNENTKDWINHPMGSIVLNNCYLVSYSKMMEVLSIVELGPNSDIANHFVIDAPNLDKFMFKKGYPILCDNGTTVKLIDSLKDNKGSTIVLGKEVSKQATVLNFKLSNNTIVVNIRPLLKKYFGFDRVYSIETLLAGYGKSELLSLKIDKWIYNFHNLVKILTTSDRKPDMESVTDNENITVIRVDEGDIVGVKVKSRK